MIGYFVITKAATFLRILAKNKCQAWSEVMHGKDKPPQWPEDRSSNQSNPNPELMVIGGNLSFALNFEPNISCHATPIWSERISSRGLSSRSKKTLVGQIVLRWGFSMGSLSQYA